jgi:hypothetical protein
VKQIISRLKRRSAATEDGSEYDGVLSYANEYHALLIGLAAGFAAGVASRPEVAAAVGATALGIQVPGLAKARFEGRGVLKEMRREPWYAIGGNAIGFVLGILATSLL